MTELTWEGKYKDDKKCSPVKIALPFQTIETVNESTADREKRIASLFHQKEETTWFNRLIWGDKKYVLPSLLPEFAGKVNLIYIDPPFDTGANFSFNATIPDNPETEEDETTSFIKEPSIIEQKAYRDTWGKGLDSYLQWFYETAILLRELLAENGSILVHLDWHVSHYCKSILDEVLGYENFRNEIVWQRTTNTGSSKSIAKKLSNDTDSIFYYGKSENIIFNKFYREYGDTYLERFKYKDERGYFRWSALKTYSEETYDKLNKEGRVRWGKNAKYPEFKQYKDELKGVPLNNL